MLVGTFVVDVVRVRECFGVGPALGTPLVIGPSYFCEVSQVLTVAAACWTAKPRASRIEAETVRMIAVREPESRHYSMT